VSPARCLALFLLVAAAWPVCAGDDYEMTEASVASGGGSTQGGVFELSGTVAQVDASVEATGGDYTLRAGFWWGLRPREDALFVDGFE
jgi:hypothetical protein